MELLEQLGLAGSYQLHQAPLSLTIDERAHQVFVGFEGEAWGELLSGLLRRYPEACPVWVISGGEPSMRALGAVSEFDALVIPAMRIDHPGGLYGLVWVVDRLLGPGGCPWDQEQTHASLKKYLLEESYELIDAIDREDSEGMVEELGDVLLQPLMHTQIKQLEGAWGIEEVARGITDKLIRRHPHVFGDATAADADEVLRNWDSIKKKEKAGVESSEKKSILAGVPQSMPALLRAMEVSKRAARSGFEWPDLDAVWEKFEEETREVKEAIAENAPEEIAAEFGDLLFTVVNLARWCKVDAEDALRVMVERFRLRFVQMEEMTEKDLRELSAEEWDELWNKAKAGQACL